MVALSCSLGTREAEGGGLEVQGQPRASEKIPVLYPGWIQEKKEKENMFVAHLFVIAKLGHNLNAMHPFHHYP